MAREFWSCFILFLVIQVVRSEQLSTKTCEDLGFTGLALCSDCQVLAEYVKDEELVSDCKKCCVQESEDSISKALKGSVGYIPPEYGLGGRITTKGDVYSYGIVLLEMLTGKMPTHNMFVEGMTLQKWVGSSFPYQVRAVVDRSLLRRISTSTVEDKEFNCLNQLVSVRLLCTKESPEGRSTMMDIVGKLQNFKEILLGVVRNTNFQSDITHLLGCPSTSHNIIGEGQSSSTF